MLVNGLDGKQYKWNSYLIGKTSDEQNKSSLHLRTRSILKGLYPADRIMEEVLLPGSYGLFCDFYLPNRLLMVEAHGLQHYQYTPFFHKTKFDFIQSKKRDRNKIQWCSINNIDIVVLPYNEDDEEWKKRLFKR